MSSTSSSSTTIQRTLTIKRSEIAEFVDGRTQGYRVRFDVIEAIDMAAEIFVYRRLPGALPGSPVRDEFSNVASPADLEEYPVGAPSSASPFFRLHYADLIFRNLTLLEQSANDLLSDVAQLVETLDQLGALTEHFVTITGDEVPPDPTAPVIKVVVTAADPTVTNDITENYANGSWWINSSTGGIWALTNNAAGAAVWIVVNFGNSVLNNYNATTSPTVNDDETAGYSIGSQWINKTTKEVFVCFDVTAGAAVWKEGGSGGGVHIAANDPTFDDDETLGFDQGEFWLNSVTEELFQCMDAAEGIADWREVSRGAILTIDNYNMAALVTVSDGDPATAAAISNTPRLGGLVQVQINGHSVEVGNGTKVADCYFSGDGGINVRNIASIVAGDTCRWVGVHAGYQLTGADTISFIYGV